MKRIVCYCLVAAITLYTAIIYRNETFLTIFYCEILFGLVFGYLNVVCIKNLDVLLRLPIHTVYIGQRVPVEIVVYNRGWLPTGLLKIIICSKNLRLKKVQKVKIYGSADKSIDNVPTVLKCEYYASDIGSVEFSIKSVGIYDYMRIAELPFKKADKDVKKLIVLPKLYDVPIYVGQNIFDYNMADEYSDNEFEYRDNDRTEIKEYVPGDSIRNIHWKLSVKTDKIMVRKDEGIPSCAVVFFLVGSASMASMFIQAALSISKSMVLYGCSHYLCWYDEETKEILRYKISDVSSLYEMIENGIFILNGVGYTADIQALKDMYVYKYSAYSGIKILALNADFELFNDGIIIHKYDYKNLKNSLMSYEIQL